MSASKRQPLGRPLPDDDESIARRAAITPERLQEAAAWWQRNAPAPLRTLLDSEPREPETT